MRERVSLERLQDGSPLLENEEESAQTLALREEVITYFYEILNQLRGSNGIFYYIPCKDIKCKI